MGVSEPTLFDTIGQDENLQRVGGKIGGIVLDFYRSRLRSGCHEFHMDQLTEYVQANLAEALAPDSPGRILRQLRKVGRLEYIVLNRQQSLYKFLNP